MPAHLLEPAIVGAILANEDRVDRGLHVVIDPTRTGTAEEGECLVVGVKHHLLSLPRVSPHEDHPAVAEADMGHLDRGRHPVDDRDLMAPVELEGFARVEAQGHVGISRRLGCRLRPRGRITPDRVVAAFVSLSPEVLEDADAGQPLALWTVGILGEHSVKLFAPGAELRLRLNAALIGELSSTGSDYLPDGLARHAQVPADPLDRPAFLKIPTPDLRNRLHNQHPKSRSRIASEASWTTKSGGSLLDADYPDKGSFLHADSHFGIRPQQRRQRLAEITRGQAFQVKPWEHLLDRLCLAQIPRQDAGSERDLVDARLAI